MVMPAQQIPAGEFKAKCLHLMDQVNRDRDSFVITKRGEPVAKLVPIKKTTSVKLFGYLKGTVAIHGNIIDPIDEQWKVAQDE